MLSLADRTTSRPVAGGFPLITISQAGFHHRPLRLFYGRESVLRHICKHMLNPRESAAWRLACPVLDQMMRYASLDRHEACRILRRRVTESDRVLSELYQMYADVVEQALRDAGSFGWFGEGPKATVAVGLSGCVVIVKGYIRTAFFPRALRVPVAATRHIPAKFQQAHRPAKAMKRQLRMARSGSSRRRLYATGFISTINHIRLLEGGRSDLFNPNTNGLLALKWQLPRDSDVTFYKWSSLVDTQATQTQTAA